MISSHGEDTLPRLFAGFLLAGLSSALFAQSVTFPPSSETSWPEGWKLDPSRGHSSTQSENDPPQIEELNEWWLRPLGTGQLNSHTTHGPLSSGRWSPVGCTVQRGGSRQVAGLIKPALIDVRAYRSNGRGSYGDKIYDQGADSALYFAVLDSGYGQGKASAEQSITGDLNTRARLVNGPLAGLTDASIGAYIHIKMDVEVATGSASSRIAANARSAVVDDPTPLQVTVTTGPFNVPIEPMTVNSLSDETHHHHISKSGGVPQQSGVAEVMVAFNSEVDFEVEAEKGFWTPVPSVLEAEARANVRSVAVLTLSATRASDGKVFEGRLRFVQE